MIQRKQTLFLLANLIISLILAFGSWTFYHSDGTTEQTSYAVDVSFTQTIIDGEGIAMTLPNQWIMAVLGLLSLASLAAVFLYKKRKLQKMICACGVALVGVLYGLIYMRSIGADYFPEGNDHFNYVTWIPLSMILFFILSWRFINSDEQLLRSIDRLR